MSYELLKGDLFDMLDGHDAILHGCNCFHTMGAGFAKQIAQRFPQAVEADLRTVYGDVFKLGSWSAAYADDICIFNAYTQYKISYTKPVFEYSAFDLILRKMALLKDGGSNINRLIMPKIGSGLAHGNWPLIEDIIKKHSKIFDITVIEYDK